MCSHRIVLFTFILVCNFNYPAYAINSNRNLNPTEKYIIKQIEKGESAFFKRYPEDDRILSADFLKELLTGAFSGLNATEKGIIINGAIIKEKLHLRDTEISYPVTLFNCRFENDVSFHETLFSGDANFAWSTFSRNTYFSETNFSGDAGFANTTFSGMLTLMLS